MSLPKIQPQIKPRQSSSQVNGHNNVIGFPKVGKRSIPANRFETSFIKKSMPDISPVNFTLSGEVVQEFKNEALQSGKPLQEYVAQWVTTRRLLEGGVA